MKNVCQKLIKTNSSLSRNKSNVLMFCYHVIKNRFTYYSIIFWDFESLQSVSKTWQVLKTKKNFFKKNVQISKYRFYDYQSRFPVIFSSNYGYCLVLKLPFPDHVFSKISKYRIENLYCPSTGKYYAPPCYYYLTPLSDLIRLFRTASPHLFGTEEYVGQYRGVLCN